MRWSAVGRGQDHAGESDSAFLRSERGRVLIDGHDVRHYTLKSLREHVALVAQDALLFSASIRNNLRYARPDATDEMLLRAIEMASLREFVEGLPDGLDTIIGERGVQVSGGQRQRLAIARAFLKDSKIVILDEATSAVDSESENQIHRAMERLMKGRTVFMIAHRLRSAMTADQIVVLDHGRIVETGTAPGLAAPAQAPTRISSTSKRADYRWCRNRPRNSASGSRRFSCDQPRARACKIFQTYRFLGWTFAISPT